MSCSQAQWLHGYFDGELDAARAEEFEAHLQRCPDCAQALAAQEELRRALGAADLYAKAPAALRARVRAALPRSPSAGAWRAPGWRLAAAAAVVLVSLGLWRAVPAGRDGERELVHQVLDAHLRSLQPAHLTDVASTDQHTVKPWFDGKLDFAPAVVDLASDGFPLIGGRLDVVGGRSAAALVYARRKHVINVFTWPAAESDSGLRSGVERGYAWVRWTRGGICYWAVSDVAPADLEELARRLSTS